MKVMKVGQVYWYCSCTEGKISFEEWHVRSIQNRLLVRGCKTRVLRAYLTHKQKNVTWTKQSKRHFDYGWSKDIPAGYRHSVGLADDHRPRHQPYVCTTKLSAVRSKVKACKSMRARFLARNQDEHSRNEEFDEIIREYDRDLRALQRAENREKNTK